MAKRVASEADDDDSGKPAELEESRMPFLSHLRELRDRVRNAALFFAAAFGVCWYFASDIFDWLKQPLFNIWMQHTGPGIPAAEDRDDEEGRGREHGHEDSAPERGGRR